MVTASPDMQPMIEGTTESPLHRVAQGSASLPTSSALIIGERIQENDSPGGGISPYISFTGCRNGKKSFYHLAALAESCTTIGMMLLQREILFGKESKCRSLVGDSFLPFFSS
jgi:hypothetical protein